MRRLGLVAVALCLVAGCAHRPAHGADGNTALDGLLLSTNDINAVMGTAIMTVHRTVTGMADDRALLPNVNCLGVWQADEAAVYGPAEAGNWQAVRGRILRAPDTEQWTSLAVQSVVSYAAAADAHRFFDESAGRWSRCTNHHINITVNDRRLPRWDSGDLSRTADRLAITVTRGSGADVRACQHVLGVAGAVVTDVLTCTARPGPATQAAEIASRIEANISR